MSLQKKQTPRKKNSTKSISGDELVHLEFHRHAVALVPDPVDPYPAFAYTVLPEKGRVRQRFCTCGIKGSSTCEHLKILSRALGDYNPPDRTEAFKKSFWYALAVILSDEAKESLPSVQLMTTGGNGDLEKIVIKNRSGEQMLIYLSNNLDRLRLVERCTFSSDENTIPTRGDVLHRLALLTMTADEKILHDRGLKTVRQAFEETFWYRFAYHGFQEFGPDGCVLHPAIEETTGTFILKGKDREQQDLFLLPVPRQKVKRLLQELNGGPTNDHGLSLQPLHLDAVFDIKFNEKLDLEIRPMFRLIQKDGISKFFRREDLKTYQYGDLYYIPELGILVEDQYPAPLPKFTEPLSSVIDKSRVPHFLLEHNIDLHQDLFRVDEKIKNLKILSNFDRFDITPEAIDHDWCWLSAIYGDGDHSICLAAVLQAKRDKQRFVATEHGWVDCQAPVFDPLDPIVNRQAGDFQVRDGSGVRLSRSDIFRLQATDSITFGIQGETQWTQQLRQLLALKPLTPMPRLKGLSSTLRSYQEKGAQWLWFLFENHFGGLLCDDMGLGKTHQIMALMVGLREHRNIRTPFLVVCPTSVISHWQQKIAAFAPGVTTVVHHGGGRDLSTLSTADVVVTSYGVMWRDIQALASVRFALVVFDEIQNIKNKKTKAYEAAQSLAADIKIGLTGTPLENSVNDLKSLFDLTVPDYMGTDEAFEERFGIPIEQQNNTSRRKELSRLISPFTLRRLKKTVLEELPEKIEDLRTCRMSEEQVRLYRDAIETRGRDLLLSLEQEQTPVPYMHIFALLTLLKQVCNHPALVAKNAKAYKDYASGKWDLFTELLAESLDSGQKIVVYSQYLGMIEIIKNYLTDLKVDFVTLTGTSTNRGQIIDRFNNDPVCRVFVGSLKAGGVGIDLVAASVVIHYDRWWNAAREDQATDRVHRIGQTRGVQVFKLLTQGTLEEKIAAIIAKKRNLMDSIVKEDDPSLIKTFSRQDLMDMLAMPVDT